VPRTAVTRASRLVRLRYLGGARPRIRLPRAMLEKRVAQGAAAEPGSLLSPRSRSLAEVIGRTVGPGFHFRAPRRELEAGCHTVNLISWQAGLPRR
jgi:hypothetical protein